MVKFTRLKLELKNCRAVQEGAIGNERRVLVKPYHLPERPYFF